MTTLVPPGHKWGTARIWVIGVLAACAGLLPAGPAPPGPELEAIPFSDVTVTGAFWRARLETNRKVTLPYNFKQCEELGLTDNFARAAGHLPAGTFQPNPNNRPSRECDVYKTIEGASYVLTQHPDVLLDLYLDALVDEIAAAQEPDGYLYPSRGFLPPEKMERGGRERWERIGAAGSQELYAVGHLYEAPVAHYQATGKRTLLDVALKNADLLCRVFGPQGRGYPPGHQEHAVLSYQYRALPARAGRLRLCPGRRSRVREPLRRQRRPHDDRRERVVPHSGNGFSLGRQPDDPGRDRTGPRADVSRPHSGLGAE